MAEYVHTDWWEVGSYTLGRKGLKIPTLGPAGYFKAQHAVRFFDQFWTLNWYGELDRYGRPHAELADNPSLILLAEDDKPTVVISGLARVTSQDERDKQRAQRTRAAEPERYITHVKRTSVLLGQAEIFMPKPFLTVTETDWVEADPRVAEPVPTTRLEVARDNVIIMQGETPGPEGTRPEVIVEHHVVYNHAVHAALTETVELLH